MISQPLFRRFATARPLALCAALLVLEAVASNALAAQTSISDEPLATRPNVKAKPNLMFVLDDSGSMNWSYMPDELGRSRDATDEPYSTKYGYWSSQCNGVAYDPTFTYEPPRKADGTSYDPADFNSAWNDGFQGGNSKTNLGDTDTVSVERSSSSNVEIGTGTKSFVVSGSANAADTFKIGDEVTLDSSTWATARWMRGVVTGWSASGGTWTLTVNVTSKAGSGSRNSWEITQTRQVGKRYYYRYTGNKTAVPPMSWRYDSSGDVDTNTDFYKQCMSNEGSAPGSNVFQKVVILDQSAEQRQNYANWYSYYRKRTFLMRTAVGRAFEALNDGYRVGFSTINSSKTAATSSGFEPVGVFDGTHKSTVFTKLYNSTANGSTPLRGALSKIGQYYANKASGQTSDPVQYSCQRNYALLSTDGYWNDSVNDSYGPRDLSGNNVGNTDGIGVDRPMHDGTVSVTTYERVGYRVGSRGGNNCSNSQYRVRETLQTSSNGTDWTPATPSAPGNNNNGGTCRAGTYVLPNTSGTNVADASQKANGIVYATATSSTSTPAKSSNTLADVAQYYYTTDLRSSALGNCTSSSSGTEQNVCTNSLKAAGRDTATHQHMTTFTIGLGVSGTLRYDRNYLTQTSGDFADIVSGAADWPVPPNSGGDARTIDDLWHAAVNGRGQYYSALNAADLGQAISGVVNTIMEETGSSAAAATSALELVPGDNNQVYQASYTTQSWTGDLKAYQLNGETGDIGTTAQWSAQTLLTQRTSARRILYRGGTTSSLVDFNWTNLQADSLDGHFSNLCSKTVVSTQCTGLSAADLTAANTGENLVNYLRGTRTLETATSDRAALYRVRKGVLGDIVNGAPVYVGKPPFAYGDDGYAAFVTSKKNRKGVVYVAANDGMLHAFSASGSDGGTELWAFVPRSVMPEMYRLADNGYESRHRFFVDGKPEIADIKVGSDWKTILVGGLGKGGRAYYALDVTDPENPQALWEFTNDNLGLSFGNPVITKRADGTWVVVFASGYNNVSPGDGKGRLFVLNANTGEKLLDIPTTAGSTDTPSGLARINAWVDDPSNNTAKRFYGGDLLGNLWRFDIDDLVEPHGAALLLASFRKDGNVQPITARPELAEIAGKAVIVVGTGRYLSTDDLANTQTQTIYAIKDALTSTSLGNVRAGSTLVQQTFTLDNEAQTASISNHTVNWNEKNGWYVDLPHEGERINIDVALQFDTLSIATAIPNSDACSSGGSSWRYYLNVRDGTGFTDVAGELWSASSLIVGQSWVKLTNDETRILRQGSDGSIRAERPPGGGGAAGMPLRSAWRELAN